MTPERMGKLVKRWARLYTRGLPGHVAQRRVDEITADLHDHIAYGRAHGVNDRSIAREIAWRSLRGVAADVAWRKQQALPSLSRPVLRVALGVVLVLSLPVVAMQLSDEVVWSLADFVLAGVLLTAIGVAIELAVRKAGNLPLAVGIGVLGAAACLLGAADDAPGLVLLGLILIVGGLALAARRRSASRTR